jgi:hypothetical protein
MLEILSIFWMSLEQIPCNILSKLCKLSFAFLWRGQNNKSHIHMCSWDTLSRPLRERGWGLKNLPLFNMALLANSLWQALTHDSIWHRIIVDKYLGKVTFFYWIRKSSHFQQWASFFLKGLTKSLFVILHWLQWRPGSGCDILIGNDMIVGMEDWSILFETLRSHLNSLNILWLDRVRDTTRLPLSR